MKNNRKIYDGNFKARVVLEVIRGQKTISEIASEYGVHTNQIINWKVLSIFLCKFILLLSPSSFYRKVDFFALSLLD